MHDTRWWRALAALAVGVLAVIASSGDNHWLRALVGFAGGVTAVVASIGRRPRDARN